MLHQDVTSYYTFLKYFFVKKRTIKMFVTWQILVWIIFMSDFCELVLRNV